MDAIITEREFEDTNSNQSSINEQEMIEGSLEGEQYHLEMQNEESKDCEEVRPIKREREEDVVDEQDWTLVQRKEKRYKSEKLEIYISCKDRMPKQFALAKIFKDEGIMDIQRVRYINPYKIRVDIANETSAEKLESCKLLINKGWRMQRAMEVSLSYGVIKDVDMDMTDEDILMNIVCPEPGQLVSASRLRRRSSVGEGEGWEPCESVRLCFKGSFRPSFVSVDGLRIRVDPYIFPVTQCARCWKLGHTTKKCTISKIVCPKCGDNHANCETTVYKCVNCDGKHMALRRSCPAYLKEKKLRDLMAEFNCTYRRALTMYVPTRFVEHENARTEPEEKKETYETTIPIPVTHFSTTPHPRPSFAEVIKQDNGNKNSYKKPTPGSSKKKSQTKETDPFLFEMPFDVDATPPVAQVLTDEAKKKKRDVKFSELISRLKEILFLRGATLKVKVQNVIKCCIEWVILVIVENISDWPTLKSILDCFGNCFNG